MSVTKRKPTHRSFQDREGNEVVIDSEFHERIPELSPEELANLEQSLIQDGCRDAVVVWLHVLDPVDGYCKECQAKVPANKVDAIDDVWACPRCRFGLAPFVWQRTVIDGHNRVAICTKHGIPFATVEISTDDLPTRGDVLEWIDWNQIARRNLSPENFRLLSGRIYNRRKAQQGGDRKSKAQIELLNTADAVADALGTSRETIKRNALRETVHAAVLEAGDREAAEIAATATQADIAAVVDLARDNPSAAATELKKRAHVTNNSGEVEWFTPAEYIEAARRVMGGIDLDPASNDIAQKTVKARRFFTKSDDGLSKTWKGRVWMNPPYSASVIDKFIGKLVESDGVTQAIVLTNNATCTAWFHLLAQSASALCFHRGRVRFLSQSGVVGTPLQGQVFAYLGEDWKTFVKEFSAFGVCVKVLS